MKSLAVIGMLSAALLFTTSNVYADDLDVTMDVMDSSSTAVDKLMNPIELPTQAAEKAHDVQANSEHGLNTANAARERAAERLDANSHSEDASENASDHTDMAGDNASEAAAAASNNASEAAARASDNANEAAAAASDNASQAAAAASDNASEHASQGLANAGR